MYRCPPRPPRFGKRPYFLRVFSRLPSLTLFCSSRNRYPAYFFKPSLSHLNNGKMFGSNIWFVGKNLFYHDWVLLESNLHITRHCGNTYWKSTTGWWWFQYSPTSKWRWLNSFPSHREERQTRVWGYPTWIQTSDWIPRMNFCEAAISSCNLWGELECKHKYDDGDECGMRCVRRELQWE